MKRSAARCFGPGFWLCAICALSACAAEHVTAAAAINAGSGRRCELTICPSHFVPAAGLRTGARSVVAGGHDVWALDDDGAIYRLNANTRQFDQFPGPAALAWISVGGGYVLYGDWVWAGTSDGRIFRKTAAVDQWQEVASPPGDPITFVATGHGHNIDGCHSREDWGISAANHSFRRNYCTDTWEVIQGSSLASIAVGGGEVWGFDSTHQVFRFDPAMGTFNQVPGTLNRIAVGVDGVWGVLDLTPVNTGATAIARIGAGGSLNAAKVFQYDAATQAFVQIPNAQMRDIAAGGNGVWALDEGGGVFRFQAATRKFIPVPGVPLHSLTVGSGTDVWGIDQQHAIRAFVTPARIVLPANTIGTSP